MLTIVKMIMGGAAALAAIVVATNPGTYNFAVHGLGSLLPYYVSKTGNKALDGAHVAQVQEMQATVQAFGVWRGKEECRKDRDEAERFKTDTGRNLTLPACS